MKKLGEQLELLFDWFVPFYERVLPKKPPKIPTWQRNSLCSKTGKMCGETANKKPPNREYAGGTSSYSTPRT